MVIHPILSGNVLIKFNKLVSDKSGVVQAVGFELACDAIPVEYVSEYIRYCVAVTSTPLYQLLPEANDDGFKFKAMVPLLKVPL
jgi:hypothetical protein